MLEEWRLSMPRAKYADRNWSCPKCVDSYWKERDPQRSDTARSASTETAAPPDQPADASDAAATPFDALKLEVVELKAEVVQLKAEVEWLKAAFVELKYADTKQTTDARPGHTIVVALTEEEAEEMRYIAKETGRRG